MLPSKKLLTVIEPIQGVLGAVVGHKLELVETRRVSTLRGTMRALDEGSPVEDHSGGSARWH